MEQYIDRIRKGEQEIPIEGRTGVRETSDRYDFSVCDEQGNVVLGVKNGAVAAKRFNSDSVPVEQNSEYDFAIKDANGKVIFRVHNGLIESVNTPSKRINVTLEGGTILTNGLDSYSYASYNGNKRSGFYIDVVDSSYFSVSRGCSVYIYDSLHSFISQHLLDSGSIMQIPTGCKYLRFAFVEDDGFDNSIVCNFYGSVKAFEDKKVPTRTLSERLLFHVDGEMFTAALLMLPPNYTTNGVKVPLIIWDSGDGSFKNWNTYEMGTGYERRRIGLEYMRDQGFAVVEIYPWGSYYYNKYYDCGGRAAMPIPTHLKCEEKGVEYLLSRYNIDPDNIFHLSKSGSGKMALGYAIRKPNFNLKHIYAFAPVFDDLNFRSWGMRDYRRALFEELNLEGTESQVEQFFNGTPLEQGGRTDGTSWYFNRPPSQESGISADDPDYLALMQSNQEFIINNAEKFSLASVGWINLIGQTIAEKVQDTFDFGTTFWAAVEAGTQGADATGEACYTRYNLTMLGSGIPIKVIMAKNDEQTPYWNCAEVVSQLRNGGCDATIVTLTSQGHSAPDMGTSTNSVSDITTILGVHYDAVSIGWYIACQDIQKRYLSHIDAAVAAYVDSLNI